MKIFIKISLIVSISIAFMIPANGQKLLKSLKEKAQERIEKKVEERVEEKVDEKIDQELDKIEESLEKDKAEGKNTDSKSSSNEDKSQQRMMRMLKGMGVTGEPVPIADSYEFDHLIQMHIESYDVSGKKINEGEFITHLNPKTKSMAYEVVSGDMGDPGQGMFIIDAENGASIILSDKNNEKTGIVYGIGSFMESMGDTYEEEVDLPDSPETYLANPNVKKTGKTKTIAGFNCEEYIYSDDETESEIWITKDLKMNTQDFFGTLFKTTMYSQGIGWGYLMESTSKNKLNGEKSIMKVTNVDKNSSVKFSMNDYKITNFGSFAPTEVE